MKLLVAIPLTASELPLAKQLVSVIAKHGPTEHDVLFVADQVLTKSQYDPILEQCKPLFSNGELIQTPLTLPDESYPKGHNFRFEIASRHIKAVQRMPFLWLSPRAIPMHKGWLREIEEEYFAGKKPFMGQVFAPGQGGAAKAFMSSTGIYPADLPKQMIQRLIAQRQTDFEQTCAEIVVPMAHKSRRIVCFTGNDAVEVGKIPPAASVVHSASPKAVAASVLGEPIPKPVEIVEKKPQQFTLEINTTPQPRAGYYHSGDLGDIVYALAAIRLAGGGKLYLGPRSRRTPPPANPMREDQFQRLKPLLDLQPYLKKVEYTDRYPGTDNAFDLNTFRTQWGDKGLRAKTGIKTLAAMHCYTLGVLEKFKPSEPWMTVTNPIETGMYAIHRSSRYRNDAFPWKNVLKHFNGKLLFVGLATEHADFQRQFGVKTAFWQCCDFLDLARIIAGSLGFIGNQSFPNSLALALGQRVLQESWEVSPDCVLPRPNFVTQPFSEQQVTKWRSSPKIAMNGHVTKVELVSQDRRLVTTKPINGVIELGPQKDAYGLGDTLAITPLAEKLGSKAVMCLPESMRHYAPLFDGLCPTRITEDYPVFVPPKNTAERFIEIKLRQFGFSCEDGKTVPVIRLTQGELDANKVSLPNTIIFHMSCAKRWEHVRTRPIEFFDPIRNELAKRFTILGEMTVPKDLRALAAFYASVGLYFGVNTGNWHLAMAVGCRCLVIDADECDGYAPSLWRYSLPNCEYVGFDQGNIIAKIPWLLNTKT